MRTITIDGIAYEVRAVDDPDADKPYVLVEDDNDLYKTSARGRRSGPTSGLSEHQLQAGVIAICEARSNADSRWGRIFAVPNGGKRDKRTAAIMKKEGVKKGVPDLFLLIPARGYVGLVLELKVGKQPVSKEQEDWLHFLTEQGFRCLVIRDSVDKVIQAIEDYLEGDPA